MVKEVYSILKSPKTSFYIYTDVYTQLPDMYNVPHILMINIRTRILNIIVRAFEIFRSKRRFVKNAF